MINMIILLQLLDEQYNIKENLSVGQGNFGKNQFFTFLKIIAVD